MKFVDIKNNVAFHKIFGNENKKEILISFLNAILDFPEGKRIKKVKLEKTIFVPIVKNLKASVLDIRATDQRGVSYIIEMQVEESEGFDKRVQYYTSKQYSTQINKGDDYPKLNQVIFIGILDFPFFKGTDYLTKHQIINKSTGEQELKDLEFNFIELPKFKLKEHELKTLEEKWIYFIKNAENLEIIPENTNDKGLEQAYHDANTHQWSKEEMLAYDYAFMVRQDIRGREQLKLKRAKEAALLEGEAKGKKEEKIEMCKTLIKEGCDNVFIKRVTGFSDDQINTLRREIE